IEASWGLGPSVVEGMVSPDTYRVGDDGNVARTIADKRTRIDRDRAGLRVRGVVDAQRHAVTLGDDRVLELARLGREIASIFGVPQDVEWSCEGDQVWILQARPITGVLPSDLEPATVVA